MNEERIQQIKDRVFQALKIRQSMAYNDKFDKELGTWVKVHDPTSRFNRPPRFITIYSTTRHYGGPEEGGWWYNWDECLQTKSIPPSSPESMKAVIESTIEQWCEEYDDHDHGDIYSVLGGSEVWFALEFFAGENESKSRPRYE